MPRTASNASAEALPAFNGRAREQGKTARLGELAEVLGNLISQRAIVQSHQAIPRPLRSVAPGGRHRTTPRETRRRRIAANRSRARDRVERPQGFPIKDHAIVVLSWSAFAVRDSPEPAGVTGPFRDRLRQHHHVATVIAEVNGGGLAVEDVDGGDEDLLVAARTMNSSGSLTLCRNQGRGQFAGLVELQLAGGWLTGLATADAETDRRCRGGPLGHRPLVAWHAWRFQPPTELYDWDGPPAWPRPISTAMATAISSGCVTSNSTPRLPHLRNLQGH